MSRSTTDLRRNIKTSASIAHLVSGISLIVWKHPLPFFICKLSLAASGMVLSKFMAST